MDWGPLRLMATGAVRSATDAAEAIPDDMVRIALSMLLILAVLVLLAAVYRGAAGDEEIERPVTLVLLANIDANVIEFAPRHFNEKTVHTGKAPRVQFFVQTPDRDRLSLLAASQPLRIKVRGRNSSNVYDQDYNSDVDDGGQVGISSETRAEIERYLSHLNRKDGRRLDADTSRFVIRLKYPTSMNLDYLLRQHPDVSVRTGAWIFILTSIFSIVQELVFRA